MRTERATLRRGLLRWLLPPILALTVLWVWATHGVVLHFANLAHDRALEDSARTLAGQVVPDGAGLAVDLPPAARRMLEFDEIDTVYFSVTDRSGRVWAGNRALPAADIEVDGDAHLYDGTVDGRRVRLAEFVTRGEVRDHDLLVRVAETLNKRELMAQEVMTYMLAPQAVFVTGLALFLWYGVGRGIAPLQRVSAAIACRNHADMGPIDEQGLPAEVFEQVHVINQLMERLGHTLDAQKRFMADATHQLRTPITVLRTQVELVLRTAEGPERERLLRDMDAACARLARLANQLLSLSRAEAGASLARAPVVVSTMVEDVVAALIPAALARGIEVSVDIEPGLPALQGDGVLLPEMLANIVDNAIRYTRSPGEVVIHAQAHDDHLLLSVSDSGPGISIVERAQVFERFRRGTAARAEGSGLGLAIAREIVQAHGGRIDLASGADDNGLQVTLTIPLSPQPQDPSATGS